MEWRRINAVTVALIEEKRRENAIELINEKWLKKKVLE